MGTPRLAPPPHHNVSFQTVQIRTYNITIGDNPSCIRGPALALTWDYQECAPIPVDLFEIYRSSPPPSQNQQQNQQQNHESQDSNYYYNPRRLHRSQFHMKSKERIYILLSIGITEEEIIQVEEEMNVIRKERFMAMEQAKIERRKKKMLQKKKEMMKRMWKRNFEYYNS